LNQLPILPDTLHWLDIIETSISQLPNVPPRLEIIDYNNSNYFHITPELSQRMGMRVNTDYNRCASHIQLIWMAKKRLERLKFCKRIQSMADEYNYRPGGFEYENLYESNKNNFI
jgi:hypothetical protein